ncbi:MAG TPA: signal peptidase I [Acidiferrobacteraceae bacterium]|nr:signal peptidase I [Acidiferrobacteraceae bacterium]HEX19734.1 signal peptidase I [Acidiferrobacteraceae bacterium]
MDFSIILFSALVITGVIWWIDRQFLSPKRKLRGEKLKESGVEKAALEEVYKEPILVEYARAFFPVILIVFILRSFLFEPFRIPSGSMYPGLWIGDFILVNKYSYGVRLPILNKKIIPVSEPRRGDVMVFRYPKDTSTNFIKRVIGLPGDRVVYRNKRLYVNDKLVTQGDGREYLLKTPDAGVQTMRLFSEKLGGKTHSIILGPETEYVFPGTSPKVYDITVPAGHYFVMGDNRDHSNDSRYWGMVPEEYLIGKAVMIWFSSASWDLGKIVWSRIGTIIK